MLSSTSDAKRALVSMADECRDFEELDDYCVSTRGQALTQDDGPQDEAIPQSKRLNSDPEYIHWQWGFICPAMTEELSKNNECMIGQHGPGSMGEPSGAPTTNDSVRPA
jgi:hypothetical protein